LLPYRSRDVPGQTTITTTTEEEEAVVVEAPTTIRGLRVPLEVVTLMVHMSRKSPRRSLVELVRRMPRILYQCMIFASHLFE
jgi:hypothetical protein